MTPEQLKWDKRQWAQYLGCSVQLYKRSRNFADCNYNVMITRAKDKKLCIVLAKRHDTPSIRARYVVISTSKETFDEYEDAVQYANEKFIPALEFKPDVAKEYGVPTKILQTLHVKTR